MSSYHHDYYLKNRDKIHEASYNYYHANKEKIAERKKEYDRKYYQENRNRIIRRNVEHRRNASKFTHHFFEVSSSEKITFD